MDAGVEQLHVQLHQWSRCMGDQLREQLHAQLHQWSRCMK